MVKQNLFTRIKSWFPLSSRATFATGSFSVSWLVDNYQTYIREGYASNSDLYSVISYLLELVPNVRFRYVDAKGEDVDTKEVRKLKELLAEPMKGMTFAEWEKQVLGYRFLTGNAFLWAPKLESGVNKGKTIELIYLPTQCVTVRDTPAGKTYKYTNGKTIIDIPADDILHIRMPQFMDGDAQLYGMSPVKAGLRALTASNEGLSSQVTRFQNQYGDSLIGIKDGADEKQVKDIQAGIDRESGSGKAGRVKVIGSDVSFYRMGMTAVDTQVLESLKVGLHTFCRMYNLPAELVDPTATKTYNNVREAKSAAYTMAVIPAVQQLVDSLNMWLVPRYGDFRIVVDTSDIPELQKDMVSLINAYRGVWQITGNEFRTLVLGLDTINDPEMDQILIPSNLMPIDFQTLTESKLNGKSDYRR